MKKIAVWLSIILIESIVALLPSTLFAAVILPLAYAQRGYYAVGGEWMIIYCIFVMTFTSVHYLTCNEVFGKDERP